MRKLIILILCAVAANAAVATITAVSSSATQAIIEYRPPDSQTCKVRVFEGVASTVAGALALTLHANTNGALFTNVDSDDPSIRPGGFVLRMSDARRKFIVGWKRGYPRDGNGIPRPSALAQNESYTALVTCPYAAVADGTNTALRVFKTAPYFSGNTYVKPWPLDAASWGNWSQPYYDWAPHIDGQPNPTQVHHDTGIRYSMFSRPGNYSLDASSWCGAGGSHIDWCAPPFVYDGSGQWATLSAIVNRGTGGPTTHTGTGAGKLSLPLSAFNHDGNKIGGIVNVNHVITDVQLTVNAKSSVATTLYFCYSSDVANKVCSTDTHSFALTTSYQTFTYPSAWAPTWSSWISSGKFPVPSQVAVANQSFSATATDTHTVTVTNSAWNQYPPGRMDTPSGSLLWITGSGCGGLTSGNSAVNPNMNTLNMFYGADVADFCHVSSGVDNSTYKLTEATALVSTALGSSQMGGFLLWGNGDNVTMSISDYWAQPLMESSNAFIYNGDSDMFSRDTVTDNITGLPVYMTMTMNGTGFLSLGIWIPGNGHGEHRALGELWLPSASGGCGGSSATFKYGNPLIGFCYEADDKIHQWTYNASYGFASFRGMYGAQNPAITWTTLSPTTITAQMIARDASFSSTYWSTYRLVGVWGDYIIGYFQAMNQDMPGMMVSISTTTGNVVSTMNTAVAFQAGLHTAQVSGAGDWINVVPQCCGNAGSPTWQAPILSVNGSAGGHLSATPQVVCPTIAQGAPQIGIDFGAVGQRCDVITIHKLCWASAWAAEITRLGSCPWGAGSPAWVEPAVGQFITDPAVLTEPLVIMSAVNNYGIYTLTVGRAAIPPIPQPTGIGDYLCTSTPASHSVGATLMYSTPAGCAAAGGGAYQWWNVRTGAVEANWASTGGHNDVGGGPTDDCGLFVSVGRWPGNIVIDGLTAQRGCTSDRSLFHAPQNAVMSNRAPTFDGLYQYTNLQSHVSMRSYQNTWLAADSHPPAGSGPAAPDYTYTQAATAVTDVYKITGLTVSNLKRIAMHPSNAQWLLKDISGPGANMAASSMFDYCVVQYAGATCGMAGESVGGIYVHGHSSTTYSGTCAQAPDYPVICPSIDNPVLGWTLGWDLRATDPTGVNHQRVGSQPPALTSIFDNVRITPDGKSALQYRQALNGAIPGWLIYDLPLFPRDQKNRLGWAAPAIQIKSAGGAVQGSLRFGVMSWMDTLGGGLYCTSRREECTTGTVGTDPFAFAAETATYPAIGSSLMLRPAFPFGEVVFFKRQFRNGSGSILSEGEMDVWLEP